MLSMIPSSAAGTGSGFAGCVARDVCRHVEVLLGVVALLVEAEGDPRAEREVDALAVADDEERRLLGHLRRHFFEELLCYLAPSPGRLAAGYCAFPGRK